MNLVKQKGKLLLVLILAFVATMTLGMLSLGGGATTAHAMSGSGTASDPYIISTKADLEEFRDKVNSGKTTIHGKLTADIDLENSAWTPISNDGTYYSGTFDGNGYTVSGLNVAEDANVGFFGIIRGATIKNLTVKGTVQGRKRAAGIVGFICSNSTVYNCTNECSVSTSSTTSNTGGIAGIAGYITNHASGIVINACTNKGNITASGTSVSAGGIVGYVESSSVTVKNSVNFGSITAKEDAGGIIGYVHSSGSSATVIGCFNKGTIKNEGDTTIFYGAGGILGRLGENGYFTAKYCGNDGSVSALAKSKAPAGGILAYSHAGKTINLSNCYNTAVITGAGSTGGLLGAGASSTVSITNSFNSGKIIATDDGSGIVAGIAGQMKGSMNYVFNYGNVVNQSGVDYFSLGTANVAFNARGSILGDGATNVSNAYYLDGTCKLGIGNNGNDQHTGSATSIDANQMRTQSSFSGWDFDKVWVMEANYPVLRHAHDFAYEADGDTIIATCERPYCDVDGGAIYSLTIKAPTLKNERGEGSEFASFDENELSVFNEAAGLSLNINNITYAKVEDGNVTDLDAAPTTAGDYVAKLTIGGAVASVSYSIGKIEVNFDKDILLNGESSTSTVSNLNEQTAATLLTDEEIERYVNGESVNIYLEVNNESSSTNIPAADKTAAKAAVTSAGAKEGAYLDLSLFKQLSNDADRTAIHESATAFDVTVDIPAELLEPFGYTRTYSIIRVHNGVAETLDCSVENGKISFSTDKFSTYLIAYSDEFDENGEYIEFTTDIVGENIRYSNDIVANESTVVVNYKITHNDGFNSILLIPQFDTNVFAIASDNSGYLISVNEVALGAAEITPVGDGTIKIVLDNTGAAYTALDGENEFFLTVTYKFISATAGEYNFGLVLSSNEENGKSEAFYITDANEQKGDQNRVAIRVIETETLSIKEAVVITIGKNQTFNKDDNDTAFDYWFTYGKQAVSVEKVSELPEYESGPTSETDNLIVSYTFDGDAEVACVWYKVDGEGSLTITFNDIEYTVSLMESAPMTAGEYFVMLSAPATELYSAAEAVYGYVCIVPKDIVVRAEAKTSEYGDEIVALTYAYDYDEPFEGDDLGIALSTEVTQGSAVGNYVIEITFSQDNIDKYNITAYQGLYTITKKALTVTASAQHAEYSGGEPEVDQTAYTVSIENLEISGVVITKATGVNVGDYTLTIAYENDNYEITLVDGTFTITKKALTVTASAQHAEYSGGEPEVDQTAYTVSIENLEISGVVITKEAGVNVGTYTLTIAYENANYELTLVDGTFTIVSTGADVVAIRAFFDKINRVYNGANQDLLVVDDSEFETYFVTGYTANGNINKIVGSYDITVTVTVDNNHNVGDNDLKDLVFVIEGAKITPAQVSVSANNVNVYYGEDPVVPVVPDDFTIVGTVYGNDNLNIAYVIKNGNQAFTPTNSTAVGSYDIVVSASNSNYDIELNDGVYKVLKATAGMINITVSAEDVYYNRALDYDINVTVNGNITLTADDYTVSFLGVYGTPVNAGSYTIVVTVTDTDNYAEKEGTDTFVIKQVKLEGVTFTYSHGNVSWTAVANDIGKTADEEGVLAKALKDGTTITYYVYNGDTLIGTYNERTFDALAATTYKVVAVASDDNYIASESVMAPAYEVTFDEGDHTANPDGEVSNLPATQYIFAGETVVAPASNPAVVGCTFSLWKVENATYTFTEAVNGDITIVAIWDEIIYTITFKYLPASETVGTDVFTLTRTYGETVDYSSLSMVPVKSSDNAGIYYTFASKWTDTNSAEYTALNNVIQEYTVTGDMTFVAVFDTNYNTFTITYYLFDNVNNEYAQSGDAQEVSYNDVIEYRAFNGDEYAWFIKDYWYGNAARTAAVPVKMPAENISVYGAYKFNIGQGDVNADGSVTTDDITLYRQWIVGGYEMTVIASGDEWATVTDANFDPEARYYLKRVADNNADESRDIRDVSITRMALVGGYDWDISTGETVTGQNIGRTKTATSIQNVMNGLTEYGRARMYMNITDTTADVLFNVEGSLYLDLGGKTLTVKSFVLNTNGKNATITVKNGTIDTINGITITAPNGNVVLEDVIGYVGGTQVNLQAANNSLHLVGAVEFYKESGSTAIENVAPIYVAENTHVVVEDAAEVVIEKIVVATVTVVNDTPVFTADETKGVSVINKTVNEIEIEGANTSSTVAMIGEVAYDTLANAVAAINASANGGTIKLVADIDFSTEEYAGYKWAGSTYNPLTITNDNVTIDLNGHTISNMGNTALVAGNLLAANGGIENFTIKNGTLLAGKTDNVTNSYVLGIAGVNGALVKNVTTLGGINIYTASQNVVIDGCNVQGTKYYSVCAQSGSSVVIRNSNVTKNTDSTVAVKIMFWTQGADSDEDMVTTANPTGVFGASSITIESGNYTKNADGTFYSEVKPVVEGGTFNFDPSACVNADFVVVEVDGVWSLVSNFAEAVEFVSASANGGTIKLLDDVTLTGEIVVAKAITIDLNGYTVTSAQNAAAFKIMGGELTLSGNGKVTGNNSVYKTIYFMGSTEQNAVNYSVLNVGSGVEVESVNGYAIMVSANNKKSYGVVANIAGTVSGYYGALYTNGSIAQYAGDVADNEAIASIATFNIESTAVLTAQDDNAAVYAAGFAKWNIASGASVSGASAIYIKSGYLTIEDGAMLNATMATYAPYVNNGNGAEVTGDGITIDNTYYPGGNPVVNFGSNLEDTITVAAAGAKKIAVYWYVKNEAQLREALAVGGEIVLGSDITVTGTAINDRLTITVDTTLNLNGHTLKSADGLEPTSNWSTLWVNNGAVANIMNGTIGSCYDTDGTTIAPYGINVGVKNGTAGTVNLTNVNVNGGITAVQVILGEVNIYSGTYAVSPWVGNSNPYGFVLNCIDSNYQAGTAVINVYGGTFENFNPADCAAEGEHTNFIATGYEVTGNNGVYTVSIN